MPVLSTGGKRRTPPAARESPGSPLPRDAASAEGSYRSDVKTGTSADRSRALAASGDASERAWISPQASGGEGDCAAGGDAVGPCVVGTGRIVQKLAPQSPDDGEADAAARDDSHGRAPVSVGGPGFSRAIDRGKPGGYSTWSGVPRGETVAAGSSEAASSADSTEQGTGRVISQTTG